MANQATLEMVEQLVNHYQRPVDAAGVVGNLTDTQASTNRPNY